MIGKISDIDLCNLTAGSITPMPNLKNVDSITLLEELASRGGHPAALAEAALLCAKKTHDYNFEGGEINIHNVDRSNYFPFGNISYAQMLHTKTQTKYTPTPRLITQPDGSHLDLI